MIPANAPVAKANPTNPTWTMSASALQAHPVLELRCQTATMSAPRFFSEARALVATKPRDGIEVKRRKSDVDRAMREQLRSLIAAIVADDRRKVGELLQTGPELVRGSVVQGHYENRLAHWIYAGDSALHVAAAGHRVEIVRTLLAAGAAGNAAGNHLQCQPLHYAVDSYLNNPFWDAARQVATLQLLLEAGVSIDATDKNGATALHHAVRVGGVTAVKFLLAANADITIRNKSGSPPFHLAVQSLDRRGAGQGRTRAAQREIIEAFLERGDGAALVDAKGRTVADAARSMWIREILSRGGGLR